MKDKILRYLNFQSFQPTILSILINPFYLIRRNLYKHIKELAPNLKGKLLDFGCGRKPYENLFLVDNYIGIDIEESGHNHQKSRVDVFYNGNIIPFEDKTFDSLFCSEVLEHIFNPDETLKEINRVLKDDALIIITVPFSWNEHEVPFDYARYSSFGITYLLERHGFKVIELRKSGSFVMVVWQLWILYIYELFKRFNKIGYLISLIGIIPLNIAGTFLIPLLPKNNSLYFNNIVLAKKTFPKND